MEHAQIQYRKKMAPEEHRLSLSYPVLQVGS